MNNNEEIGEKYLPVGTVVRLKGGTKRVMIIGFCAAEGDSMDVYDYSGCLFPEGLLSSSEICLFNHSQIDQLYHTGLKDDEEERNFKNELNNAIEKINNEKNN